VTPAPHLLCGGNLDCLLFYRHREVVVREEGLEKTTRVELVDLEPLPDSDTSTTEVQQTQQQQQIKNKIICAAQRLI